MVLTFGFGMATICCHWLYRWQLGLDLHVQLCDFQQNVCSSYLSTTIFGFVLAKMYLGFLSFVFSLGFPAVLNTTALYKCRLPDTSRYQNKTYLILDLIIRMRSFTDYNTSLGLDQVTLGCGNNCVMFFYLGKIHDALKG